MTQPDRFFPPGAANFGSFAAFAARSAEEWEASIRDGEVTRWGEQILDFLFEGLERAGSFVMSLLTTLAQRLLAFLPDNLDTPEEILALLQDWANQINGAADGFAALIDGVLGTGHQVQDLVDHLQQIGEDAGNAIANFGLLLSATGQTSIAALGALIRDILAGWQTALALVGLPSPDHFVRSLQGLIPAALPQANGSFVPNAIAGFTDNLNGTWQFVAGQAENDVAHLIQQADGTIVNAAHLMQQAQVAANVAGVNIGQAVASGQQVVDALVNAGAGVVAGAEAAFGAGVQAAQEAAANLFGGAPQFLRGFTGSFGQQETNNAYAAAATQSAAQAADLAQQQAAFNAVFNVAPSTAGNVNETIDFTGIADQAGMSGIMLPGSGSGTGYMGVTSGEAKLQGGSSDDLEVFPVETVSEYQIIEVTLGNLNNVLSGNNTLSINDGLGVVFRCNSDRTTYCELILFGVYGTVHSLLRTVVSGNVTNFVNSVTGAFSGISVGGKIRIFAGDPSSLSPYAFQVLYNATPIITYSDASHVSQRGAGQRYVGLRSLSQNGSVIPPSVRAVTYQDNPPPPSAYPFSGRPAADPAAKGRQYASSDCGRTDRDNGGAWENIYLGPKAFAVEPPTSGWSWVNQGGATIAADADAQLLTAPSSTRSWRMRTRTLTPSSNYAARVYVEASGVPVAGANGLYTGIGLRDASSGGFISFGPSLYNGPTYYSFLAIFRWTNATTVNSETRTWPGYYLIGGKMPNWLGIRDDGSNRYFEYSDNGVDWILFHSESRTAFITADQFFVGADNEGSGRDLQLRLRSLTGIS